jgi:hypothetical protein
VTRPSATVTVTNVPSGTQVAINSFSRGADQRTRELEALSAAADAVAAAIERRLADA